MIRLGTLSEFDEEKLYPIEIDGRKLLIIHHNNEYKVIENKCGHFEMPLDGGSIENGAIRCPVHGITFDLTTGKAINRPYEQCVPVVVLKCEIEDGKLYLLEQ